MVKRHFYLIIFLISSLVLLIMAWIMLPILVDSMPGRIRGRIPEEIMMVITTPLPTSLPVPLMAEVSELAAMEIPTLEPIQSPKSTQAMIDQSVEPTIRSASTSVANVSPSPMATLRPTQEPTSTRTPIVLPYRARIEGLELIPQKFNNCGPANLTISLNFYGHSVDQLSVGEALKPNYDDRNVSPEELINFVEQETNLNSAVYRGGDLLIIKQLLAAGFPVIVEKGLLLNDFHGWMGHYLTLIGYNESEQKFEVLDTFLGPFDGGRRYIDFQELDTHWAEFNYTFLLIYEAEDQLIIETILGPNFLDEITMWQNAARKSQVGLGKDGHDPFLWFNLGSSLTELGELTGDHVYFQSAANAFDRATTIGLPWRMLWYQFNPYRAYLATGRLDDVMQLTSAMLTSGGGQNVEETYLYRGHAQVAKNDFDGAERSYKAAIRLNPGMQAAFLALAEIQATDGS